MQRREQMAPTNHAKARIVLELPRRQSGSEDSRGRGDGRVDVGCRMRRRQKSGLERGRREIHALRSSMP